MEPSQIDHQLAEAYFTARQKSNEERLLEETKVGNSIQYKLGIIAAAVTLMGVLLSTVVILGSSYLFIRDSVTKLNLAQVQHEKARSELSTKISNLEINIKSCQTEIQTLKLEIIKTNSANDKLLDRVISIEKLLERKML